MKNKHCKGSCKLLRQETWRILRNLKEYLGTSDRQTFISTCWAAPPLISWLSNKIREFFPSSLCRTSLWASGPIKIWKVLLALTVGGSILMENCRVGKLSLMFDYCLFYILAFCKNFYNSITINNSNNIFKFDIQVC